ncbi:MAG TPA: DUF58 domain-containing protein [Vicinamibacterales bacterium]
MLRPLVPSPAAAPAAAVRRVAYGATPRCLLLLLAGVLLLIPAWTGGRAGWAFAAWDIAVLAAWLLDLRRLPHPRSLEITRIWSAALTLRTPARVRLSLANHSGTAIHAWLTDDVHASLRRTLPEIEVDVAPQGAAEGAYDVEPRERGDAAMGRAFVRYRSALGLAERWAAAAVEQTVRVYPDLQGARRQAMYLVRSRQVALEKRRARAATIGREFESLRDFRDGDEQRDVCWTATARRGRLVTKVYQPERSQAVWLVVDGGRLLRARIGDRMKLDAMVDAALAIAEVAMTAGDRVGLITYGGTLRQQLPPARGPRHLRAIVEALAVHRAQPVEADHSAAAAALLTAQKQRALVVWLTDLADTAGVPDVIDGAAQLSPRHVVIFGVMREPELTELAAAAPESPQEMYRVLAAQESSDRRALQLRAVSQRGVLALEVPAGELVPALVNQYLSVKEQGRI